MVPRISWLIVLQCRNPVQVQVIIWIHLDGRYPQADGTSENSRSPLFGEFSSEDRSKAQSAQHSWHSCCMLLYVVAGFHVGVPDPTECRKFVELRTGPIDKFRNLRGLSLAEVTAICRESQRFSTLGPSSPC